MRFDTMLFDGCTVPPFHDSLIGKLIVHGGTRQECLARHGDALAVKAGQALSFDFLKTGARVYIAFAGGIDVPEALGSRSTCTIGALGGFKGRPLAKGDSVPLLATGAAGKPAELRVLPGLYWHRITESSRSAFFNDDWSVAPEADRMGYRFRGGRPLSFVEREQPFGAGSGPSNIVDSCHHYGSIQAPGGTEPIILRPDAVSGGGYFMIGTAVSADMDLIGQMQPNTPTRFVKVDMEEALKARAGRDRILQGIRNVLG